MFLMQDCKGKEVCHQVEQCPDKEKQPTCANCKKIRKPFGQRIMDQAYPVYKAELKLEIRIDF